MREHVLLEISVCPCPIRDTAVLKVVSMIQWSVAILYVDSMLVVLIRFYCIR